MMMTLDGGQVSAGNSMGDAGLGRKFDNNICQKPQGRNKIFFP